LDCVNAIAEASRMRGVPLDVRSATEAAVAQRRAEVVARLLERPFGGGSLFSTAEDLGAMLRTAARLGDAATVAALLGGGADGGAVDAKGQTAAAISGKMWVTLGRAEHAECIRRLVGGGMAARDLDAKDAFGFCLLKLLCIRPCDALVDEILQRGASATLRDFDGNTPAATAVTFRCAS
jgi:hypothetical protein